MTAPKPLPRCPVCHKRSRKLYLAATQRFARAHTGGDGEMWHDVVATGRTQAEADARWRRGMGGKK